MKEQEESTINYTVKELIWELRKEISDLKISVEASVAKENVKLDEINHRVMTTNGKVKLNRWIATTALSLVMVALGFVLGGG